MKNLNIKEIFLFTIGYLTQIFFIKHLFVKSIRLKSKQIKFLYDTVLKEEGKKFIINETILDNENETPVLFSGFFKLKKLPFFYISFGERLFTAGWTAKDVIGEITYFRWHDKSIKNLIKNSKIKDEINIYILTGDRGVHLGSIKKENEIDKEIKIRSFVKPLEDDIIRLEKGEIKKTSSILYGEPGNGKTTAIRELAKKYGYNIYFVTFDKEVKNADIIQGLSYVADKSFIIFEDFDSVFDKREVLNFEKPNFTFDAILNSLDGIYNNYNKIVFFMTANDISKIDTSLKDRPSRMKHKIIFTNPTIDEINDILKDDELSEQCLGFNMDEIFLIKDMQCLNSKEDIKEHIIKIKNNKE